MAKSTTRRNFLRGSGAATFAALALPQTSLAAPFKCGAPDSVRAADSDAPRAETETLEPGPLTSAPALDRIDLSPARWIWFPSERTLPNTFVLFRRELNLPAAPTRVRGWITADSRYLLTVNGQRIQWGPAPCDPRRLDVDPIDLNAQLKPGINVLGVEVLFYGVGESTWVAGKPGLLCRLEVEYADGRKEQVISDDSWQCYLDRAHRPGQYKRWYLRALQEEFDARLHPPGWDVPGFRPDREWVPAIEIEGPADKPTLCNGYRDDLMVQGVTEPAAFALRPREIPMLREVEVPAQRLAESGRVVWLRNPLDWFELRMPGSFRISRETVALERGDGRWELPATPDPSVAVFATFEFMEEIVGFPYFTIDAPEGTVVELIFQESHDLAGTAWLDTHWYAWSRFICREGVNRFETFDFEPVRWLQLHIRNATRPVTIGGIGVRRRLTPWPNDPHIQCSEPVLQRLVDASINSLHNSAQETSRDPGRERQQYGGAGSIQLIGVRYAFGETRLPRRVLRTYSEGLTWEGYFLDPWPACEPLDRLGQRQIGSTIWGSQIDEGVTFAFNCWYHYLETGDREALREPYVRLLRFAEFLERARLRDGLLPIEHVGGGVLNVWLDDDAFTGQQRRVRQCPFNLHTAAMLKHAVAPLAEAYGQGDKSARLVKLATDIEVATASRFWSAERGLFVDNLPWLHEDKKIRLTDRTLATSILFDQCPAGNVKAALASLVKCPPEMAFSYPMNSIWRYWALARLGRADVVLKEMRTRWATMKSVIQNNVLPEIWNHQPDTRDEWSYFQVTPLISLFMDIAGIRPTAPGFARCQVRPQLGDLGHLELTAYTVRGPIQFAAQPTSEGHRVTLSLPEKCDGELLLPPGVPCRLPPLVPDHPLGLKRFRLQAGGTSEFLTRT
jgi:alpha-L-rhamnosidase